MSRPRLVIFISHRWESDCHPDPNQQQLHSLHAIISNMKRVMEVVESGNRECLPSLRRHSVLQAAELVYRLVESPLMDDDGIEELSSDNILEDYVGVWYDFISMPQHPRTVEEQDQFNACLKRLSNFVALPVAHTLSLRCDGDDYDSRAWCVAEICAAWGLYREMGNYAEEEELFDGNLTQLSLPKRYPMCLRMDLLNEPLLVPDDLNEVDALAMLWESESRSEKPPVDILLGVIQALQRHSKSWHRLDRGRSVYHCPTGADLSCRWSVLVANEIYCSSRHADAADDDKDGHWVDLEGIIRKCGHELQMTCTNQKDVVLAGLITCHALHWPEAALQAVTGLANTNETNTHPSFRRRDLFSDALERWVDGKSLRFWMRSDLISAIFVERGDSCCLDRSVFLYDQGDNVAFIFEET
jgi:hypothetical protein